MAKEEEKKEKKVKRPTAIKRDLQSKRRRMANKIYKSRVRTAIRSFQDALDKGDEAAANEKLNEAYSILDKCAQKRCLQIE